MVIFTLLALQRQIRDNLPFCWRQLLSIYVNEPERPAQACVIWMHGLGADAQDMAGLAQQLQLSQPVRHVFIDAPVRPVTLNGGMPMRAWYDIVGLALNDREDQAGIAESETIINDVIAKQCAAGMASEKIFLAGFSQGGAMALFAGLQSKVPLAGVIALSAYLPLANRCNTRLPKSTPFFIANGQYDPIVFPDWTKQSTQRLHDCGFGAIAVHEYPMEHSICADEIMDLSKWINKIMSESMKQTGGM